MLGLAQLIVPPAPADGVEQAKAGPDVCVSDTKVRSPGRVSVRVAVSAGSGPPFCIAIAVREIGVGRGELGRQQRHPDVGRHDGPTSVDWVAVSFSSKGSDSGNVDDGETCAR